MNPLRAWDAFWFRPVWARPLGVFRVLVGVLTLCHLTFISADLDYWLSDRGVLQGDDARMMAGALRPSPLQVWQGPAAARTAVGVTAAAAVALIVGWRSRAAAWLVFLGSLVIHHRNFASNCGPDNMHLLLTFYLALSPCGLAVSLDALRESKRRGGAAAEPVFAPWAVRLIQLQTSLVYVSTAVIKASGKSWTGGTALHLALNNYEFGRFDFRFLSEWPIAVNLMTVGTLAVEIALPFLLWFKATRRYAALAGLGLHLGVLVMMNIPMFGELMTATYLLFLDPAEFQGLARAVSPRRWLRLLASLAAWRPSFGRAETVADAVPAGIGAGLAASKGFETARAA